MENALLSINERKEDSLKEKYEALLELAGTEGKFQKALFLIYVLASFVSCLTITIIPLQKDIPSHFCVDSREFDDPKYDVYKLQQKHIKIINNEHCTRKFCKLKDEFDNELLSILVVDYSSITNFVSELDIFCEHEDYFTTITQYLFTGRLIGTLIFSYISDKYGRLSSISIQFYLLIFCHFSFLIIKNKYMFCILALISNSCLNIWNTLCIMTTEIMSPKLYSLANGFIGAAFSLTGVTNILIVYYFRNWNILLYIHLGIIFGILYFGRPYMIETPKYLLENRRYKELNEVIVKISNTNNSKEQHAVLLQKLEEIKQKQDNETDEKKIARIEDIGGILYYVNQVLGPYLIIFQSHENTLNILKTSLVYITIVFIYFGQLFYIEELPGNLYFNLSVIFIAEVISDSFGGILLQRFNRKQILIYLFIVISFLLFIVLISTNHVIILIAVCLIAFSVAITFIAFLVYMSELMDINVRSTSISIVTNCSSLFIIISPYVIKIFYNSAYLTFLFLSFICLLNVMILKDTKVQGGAIHH